MGKADKHVKKFQEILQRSSVLNPYVNMPFSKCFFYANNQVKLAEDLISKKKHK